jgi:hypothetical protein
MDQDATLTPSEPIPPPPSSAVHKIFIGKDGLRAGWSLLIYITFFVFIIIGTSVVRHSLPPHAPRGAKAPSGISAMSHSFIGECIFFLVTFLVTWIMSKIEQRPNGVYGLGGSRKLLRFLAGLTWGVICLSLLVLTLLRAGFLVIDSRLLFGSDILRYGAIWLLIFLLVGLFEEYFTRGYLQYTLTRGLAGVYQWAFKTPRSATLGFWTSAALVSLLFGLGHRNNPGESPIGLLNAGLASMVFCLSLWRTGSLWWAIGFHAAWDWSQSFLYGVADSGAIVQYRLLATHPVGKPILSGGATGPEGSIFTLVVLALASLIILITLPRAQYSQKPHGSPPG